ncbi:CAP domain-containing protein [Patescibacteria group bacterium]
MTTYRTTALAPVIPLLLLLTLAAPSVRAVEQPTTGSLVKTADSTAVYYYAANERRYVFPNQRTYHSWFVGFDGVIEITAEQLAEMTIGGNVTYRPGVRMVKIQSDPRVYAVDRHGTLRWIQTEGAAEALYGPDWSDYVDDVSDAFFVNYHLGEPIASAADFDPDAAADGSPSVGADLGLPAGASEAATTSTVPGPADHPDHEPTGGAVTDEERWRQFAFEDINAIRAEHSRPPLVLNDLLSSIAMAHSKDMAFNIGEMSHDGSLGEDFSDRVKRGQVPDFDNPGAYTSLPVPSGIGWAGENVGMRHLVNFGFDAEAAIRHQHEWFLDEPDGVHNHRTTMLSSLAPFNEIGIGIYKDESGRLWITEDYISR